MPHSSNPQYDVDSRYPWGVEGLDVGAIDSVDENALQCHYCGCTKHRPCLLFADSTPADQAELERHRRRGGERVDVQPCSWQRVVELVGDGRAVRYFACCTNAECVKAYLGDRSAP